ncbi:MAG: 23S rRNA (adenine(2030)-N(6))-methyltransferase RlmJ [Treponema sp.]
MLSYVHDFHAGNHGDVLKHAALALILKHLNCKDKPYTFFDTHAGSGVYNLSDERAAKTGENVNGILRLQEFCKMNSCRVPEGLKPYLSEVERYNVRGLYPGSPRIAADFMRGDDKLILSELHPAAYGTLCKTVRKPFAAIHRRNGWEMLIALTPPTIKRGAALIDPSYELASDYECAAETVIKVHRKWQAGIIALWYPLLSYRMQLIGGMKEKIVRAVKRFDAAVEILNAELCVNSASAHTEVPLHELNANNAPRMYGSGLLVINFPWQLDKILREILPFLAEGLSADGLGGWKIQTEF